MRVNKGEGAKGRRYTGDWPQVRLALLIGVLFASTASGQTPSVQDGALRDWTSQRDMLLKISAALPADKFGFRPTPAQRTWGEQILHIAQANVNQMGRLGSKAPAAAIDMKLTAPAAILKVEKQRGRINWLGTVNLNFHQRSRQFVEDVHAMRFWDEEPVNF